MPASRQMGSTQPCDGCAQGTGHNSHPCPHSSCGCESARCAPSPLRMGAAARFCGPAARIAAERGPKRPACSSPRSPVSPNTVQNNGRTIDREQTRRTRGLVNDFRAAISRLVLSRVRRSSLGYSHGGFGISTPIATRFGNRGILYNRQYTFVYYA